MKLILLGDCHIGARSDNLAFHDYFQKFFSQVLFPYMEKEQITHIIQLGDLFDKRQSINFVSLHRGRQYFFDPLRDKGLTMDVFVGNHDTAYRSTNEVNSPHLLLGEYNNIQTFSEPVTMRYDDIDIALLPWVNSSNYASSMEFIQSTPAPILLGHLEIAGFEMYRGTIIDHGLPMETFHKFDLVCSGHYHHRSTRANITYCGTPYQITWSDFDDPRGFHVFDTTTRSLEFVLNPYRMFHKIFYNDSSKTMEQVVDRDYSMYSGTYVKVVVQQKTNPYWFDLFIDKLEKSGTVDVQVVDDHLNLNLDDDNEILQEAEDTLTILRKVVDGVESPVPKSRLEDFLINLYREAQHHEQ